jgi:XTP/dITP diphosphohydrolase
VSALDGPVLESRLVLATRNRHKLAEMRRILAEAGLAYEVLGLDELPDGRQVPDVVESGATFEANALLKSRAVAAATGLLAVADDSGLAVDALNGMPGIFSARWSGRHGDDAANLALLLGQLADVPDERLTARFVCAAAVSSPDGRSRTVHGEMVGSLVREPRGSNGFGYDPIFLPTGLTRTSAELSDTEKDAISHRGQALAALVPVLRELLGSLIKQVG